MIPENIGLLAPDEEFRQVKNYNTLIDGYLISNYGRCYSLKTMRFIYQRKNKKGYIGYKLCDNGREKYTYAHRLVAFAFVKNMKPEKYNTLNHIDENPSNNYYKNLEWCDAKYNLNYATAQQRRAIKRSKTVIQLDKNFNVINEYISLNEASRQTGICITPLFTRCHDGLIYGNYYWRYKNVDYKEVS